MVLGYSTMHSSPGAGKCAQWRVLTEGRPGAGKSAQGCPKECTVEGADTLCVCAACVNVPALREGVYGRTE